MRTHRDLDVWKLAIEFVAYVYEVTRVYPESEKFGLVGQLRRASVGIPSHIAEGAARRSIKDFNRFLNMAQGSLAEVETQLIISVKLGYISEYDETKIVILSKMISGLIRSNIKKLENE